jgi:hypothetical protein
MQYRIKQVDKNGRTYFYPQYKKFLFWRRFVWWGGEDGTFPHTLFCTNMENALVEIKNDERRRREKSLEVPKKTIYHYID